MKKLFSRIIILIFLSIIIVLGILSTTGIKTKKFNKFISDKTYQSKNINLELNEIKFKLDPKDLSLFLATKNPIITYKEISIPVDDIKIYFDFISLFDSNPVIKKTNVNLKELDIVQLNKLSNIIKPSNLKSLLNNNIKKGKLKSEIEIFLNEEGILENFIAKGNVYDLNGIFLQDLILSKTSFNFFADKSDILIKNLLGNIQDIRISDGDLKLNLENGIKINSNFISKINLNDEKLKKYLKFFEKYYFVENIKTLKAEVRNNFSLELDETYKVKNYLYSITGKLEKSNFKITPPLKSNFFQKEIKEIYLSDLQIEMLFEPNNIALNGDGKYSFNNSNFLKVSTENNFKEQSLNFKADFEYEDEFSIDLINYKKKKNSVANLFFDIKKKKNNILINKIGFNEENNSVIANGLKFKDDKFHSFKKVKVLTKNNDFLILNDEKISVKGSKFDASNLAKFLNDQDGQNEYKNFTSNVEIDFKKIKVPMSENLENFKLIGEIKKGKFVKITSKGDFGGNNFLDISMKSDKSTNKKYLEIYSDLTRPLLTEYSFFNGLSGGKLLYTSIIDDLKSNSKLKIENFKLVNAPGVIKFLSLADLRGLADLAEGEGLSFDILEINMEKDKDLLKLNEIIALGPSMSVLMEGYQSKEGLTSIRGTLVPAKTLNKIIAKIPVIGNIVIPKEIGEGLFGISFKMKGPRGQIKTTINPIRTLTPRFIQKIIDNNKQIK